MACETERNPLGVFKCQLCAITAPYSYKGLQPSDSQSVVLLEESYVMRDPFTPDKGRFLIVGSRCSMCSRLVCVGPVGMQFILHQEILPPLCPGQRGCFPSGNSARLGEKERPLHEACQPAQFSTMSAVGYQVRSDAQPGPVAQVRDGAEMGAAVPAFFLGHWELCLQPRGAGVRLQQHQGQEQAEKVPTGRPQTPVLQGPQLPPHSPRLSSW